MAAKPKPNPVDRMPRANPRRLKANQRCTRVMIGVHRPVAPRPANPKKRHAVQRLSAVPINRTPQPNSSRQTVMTRLAPRRSVRYPVNGVTAM